MFLMLNPVSMAVLGHGPFIRLTPPPHPPDNNNVQVLLLGAPSFQVTSQSRTVFPLESRCAPMFFDSPQSKAKPSQRLIRNSVK